jgi:hypothetical protein
MGSTRTDDAEFQRWSLCKLTNPNFSLKCHSKTVVSRRRLITHPYEVNAIDVSDSNEDRKEPCSTIILDDALKYEMTSQNI